MPLLWERLDMLSVSLLLFTFVIYWWIFLAAVKLSGVASLLPFPPQNSLASSNVSLGSVMNQNSLPSINIDVWWCPSENHDRQRLTAAYWWGEKKLNQNSSEHWKIQIFSSNYICNADAWNDCLLPGLYQSGVFGVFPNERERASQWQTKSLK